MNFKFFLLFIIAFLNEIQITNSHDYVLVSDLI